MLKKILVVTGTRAEYGLLRDLILRLQSDPEIDLQVAVTGTHLSPKHGMTVKIIESDGIKNLHHVDLEIDSDTPLAITNGVSLGLSGFGKLLNKLNPNLVILLGDRYELWSAAMAATLANIPIAHIHGGESTVGVIDESVRHSITKMSHLHFASHEHYANRILRMGENPKMVWNVGAVGLDRIKKMTFLPRVELEKKLGTSFSKTNLLCTFHPVTLDKKQSEFEIESLINALETKLRSEDIKLFITLPNADSYSNHIRICWKNLISQYPTKVFSFENLGDLVYLSLMNEVDLILGNSSSGILEAPFLKKAVLNIGKRQEGRLSSYHVIHSNGEVQDLEKNLNFALSQEFQSKLQSSPSIYGDGDTTEKIFKLLKETPLEGVLYKAFFDA